MKQKLLLSLILLPLLTLTSCSHIEDSNGSDNYNLVSISDDDIIKGKSSFSSFSKSWTSHINGIKKANLSISKFSGVKELDSTYITSTSITYSISNTVLEGNFLVCVIYKDNIIKKIEANMETHITLNEGDGQYILKIAGESANFSLQYEITTN